MARMLGGWRRGGCGCGVPGPDCSGHVRDPRWRRRVEGREWRREAAEALTSDEDQAAEME